MKLKLIAKRLRTRSETFQSMALTFQNGDSALAERARIISDVLLEVADQISPPSKKKLKKRASQDRMRRIAITKAESAS